MKNFCQGKRKEVIKVISLCKNGRNMWAWYSRPIHLKISKLGVQTGKALSGLVNDDNIIFILKLKKKKQKKNMILYYKC